MRRCPACKLPTQPNEIGLTFSASSNDNSTHGVIGVCTRCTAAGRRLPKSAWFKTVARAGDRALASPGPYLCTTYPTLQTAQLAAAMLQHPQHVLATLDAIGWGDDMNRAI